VVSWLTVTAPPAANAAGDGERGAIGRKAAADQGGDGQQSGGADGRPGGGDPGRSAPGPGDRPLLAAGALGQQAGRRDQHHDDKDQERHHGRDAVERRVGREVLRPDGGEEANDDATDVGEGQAREPPHGHSAEGLDDQRGEHHGVEAQTRGDQDAGGGGEGAADDPRDDPHPSGARPGLGQQVGGGHDGLHRHTEAGAAEEEEQPGEAGDADDHDDQLGPADRHPGDPEGGRGGQELGEAPPFHAVAPE
jgi:hypothetical protein